MNGTPCDVMVQLVREGNPQMIRVLLEEAEPLVRRIARRAVGQWADQQDLSQELRLRTLHCANRWTPGSGDFFAYLKVALRRLAECIARQQWCELVLDPEEAELKLVDQCSPLDCLRNNPQAEALRLERLLRGVPSHQRHALQERLRGRTLSQIAQDTHTSHESVRRRSLAALRAVIRDRPENPAQLDFFNLLTPRHP